MKTREGGPGSPGFWREYTIDLIMTLNESNEWEDDDIRNEEAREELVDNNDEGYWEDELSKANKERWEELDEEEKHNMDVVCNSRYLWCELKNVGKKG